jgi:hypothetical protein
MYLERTRQKRKALHMLALSGVVRPSHVELRYAIPLLTSEDRFSAFQENPVTAVRPSGLLQKFFELMSWLGKSAGWPRQYLSSTISSNFVKVCPRAFVLHRKPISIAQQLDDRSELGVKVSAMSETTMATAPGSN